MTSPAAAGAFTVPALPPVLERLWDAIFDLCERLDHKRWLLVGGQMVMAHGLAVGRTATRASRDIDVLADLVTSPEHLRTCVQAVKGLGFEGMKPLTGSTQHRFVHRDDGAVIDVLAPDHTPPRFPLTTVPPYHTIAIDGGHQALQRAVTFEATKQGRTVILPVPSVLGALVLKGAAFLADGRDRERHAGDAAFLASLLADPLAARSEFKGSDRRRLEALDAVLSDRTSVSWRQLGAAADDAYAVWKLLRG